MYTLTPPVSVTDRGGAASAAPTIRVECRYLPGGRMRASMPPLPRFGLSVAFDKRLSMLSWHGKGPGESYVDRQSAARVGVYEGAVAAQLHPYLRPQESGNKVRVEGWTGGRVDGWRDGGMGGWMDECWAGCCQAFICNHAQPLSPLTRAHACAVVA